MHLIAIFNKEVKISLRKDRTELLICFGIAAVFWVMVKLSQDYPTHWKFSFEYVLPEDQAFIEKPPDVIDATITGSGWKLMYFSLFHRHRPLVFDLQKLPISVLERRLVIDRIQTVLGEAGLEVADINLEYTPIRLGPKGARKVPIKLRYHIGLAPQHQFVNPITLMPDSVLVTGPVTLLDSLRFWPTDTGQIGPLKANHFQTLPLAANPDQVLDLGVKETELKVEVEPVVEKTIYFVPVLVTHAPDSIRIFPASVTVYCVVGMSMFNALDPSDFTVEADLSGMIPHSDQNTVLLNLTCAPDYVKNVRFSPQSVEFFIQKH